MTPTKITFDTPKNSISSFFGMAYLLCEGNLYPVNTPLQIFKGNKSYTFCLACDKKAEKIWIATQNTPISVLPSVVESIYNLMQDTLPELQMDMNLILISDVDSTKISKLNQELAKYNTTVTAFKTIGAAHKYLTKNIPAHNHPYSETVEACWDYINTLIEYLNTQEQ